MKRLKALKKGKNYTNNWLFIYYHYFMNKEQLHSEWVTDVVTLQDKLYRQEIDLEQFISLKIEVTDKYYRRIQDIINQ